jgi:hypothetical protein
MLSTTMAMQVQQRKLRRGAWSQFEWPINLCNEQDVASLN